MGLFNWLFGSSDQSDSHIAINTDGTPMLNDSVDVAGKPFGASDDDITQSDDILSNNWMSDDLDTGSSFDDSFDSMDSSSGFDDW